MTDRPWLSSYPPGVPAEIDPSRYPSLVALIEESFAQVRRRAGLQLHGQGLQLRRDRRASSRAFAAYLQGLGAGKGDRVAVMMPNCRSTRSRWPASCAPGCVVVNVNPLYTPRELEHQLKDSGAKAIVILENFGTTLQSASPRRPVKHVVLAAMGDLLGLLKGALVNYVVRNVKKMVPAFSLPGAVRFNDALAAGRQRAAQCAGRLGPDDVAVLQYTGGTTGVSKGAVLLHRNVIANVLQSEAWNQPAMEKMPGRRAAHQRVRAAAVSHLRASR